jgi:2'-hydroxyisoflavone reductase
MISVTESGGCGTYQATGPEGTLTMGELVDACIAVGGNPARAEWIDEAFLLEQGVQPWKDMPLWLPESDPAHAGFMAADCARAIALGLAFRPIRETVADTLAWSRTREPAHVWKAGMAPHAEARLLDAWARWRTALA